MVVEVIISVAVAVVVNVAMRVTIVLSVAVIDGSGSGCSNGSGNVCGSSYRIRVGKVYSGCVHDESSSNFFQRYDLFFILARVLEQF